MDDFEADEFSIGIYMLQNENNIDEFGTGIFDTLEKSILKIIGELIRYILQDLETENRTELRKMRKSLWNICDKYNDINLY